MKGFQLIIIIAFIFFAAVGVFVFATYRGSDAVKDVKFTIWGEMDEPTFNKFLSDFRTNTDNQFSVNYDQIEGGDFINNVVNAIASGVGPDIVVLSSEDILRFEDKIFTVPYEVISERDFRDTFIEGGEIFLSPQGVIGLPFTVDPMITYWNRDILQSNGFSGPPKFWSEFFPLVDRITERDDALNIRRSAVALGGYNNINNAKEIILSMLFQNSNNVVERDSGGSLRSTLSDNLEKTVAPAESVIRFYTEFSNPAKTSYSWNRSLPSSIDAFSSGDLALYFGFASELDEIRSKNPNLNFDVSIFPQPTDDINKKVFGKMNAFVILKTSPNANLAMSLMSALIREDNISALSGITGLPPVRRSLLSQKPGLAFEDLVYESSLVSRAFLDPSPVESDVVFADLIDRVVSGRERIGEAVSRSDSELSSLLRGN